MLNAVMFLFFTALAITSAILMVTRRNIVHGAVFLITTLLATAGIFLQLQAEFLFVVQIILYVGADARYCGVAGRRWHGAGNNGNSHGGR